MKGKKKHSGGDVLEVVRQRASAATVMQASCPSTAPLNSLMRLKGNPPRIHRMMVSKVCQSCAGRRDNERSVHLGAISHLKADGSQRLCAYSLRALRGQKPPAVGLNPYQRPNPQRHHNNTQEHIHDISVVSLRRALSSDSIKFPINVHI
jgi:hypothetical protein